MNAPFRIRHVLEGSGVAAVGDRSLGEVEYSLRDVEDVRESADGTGTERTIYGVVTTVAARVLAPYVGARLELRLADGRRLDFTVAKVMTENAVLIQALGALR